MSLAVQILRDPERAAALLQPVRIQMLERLREPASATTLARAMGLPRQQVNYHLRELERHGAVECTGERRKGNCIERLMQVTAASFVISPEALGGAGAEPEQARDRFSIAYLVATAARAIRELAILTVRARRAGKRLATLTLETEIRFRNAAERHQFAEELAAAVASLAAKYHDEHAAGGRAFRVLAASYPLITKTSEEPAGALESAAVR